MQNPSEMKRIQFKMVNEGKFFLKVKASVKEKGMN